MRKLILEHWISLDGYASDVNGATDFFPTTEQNRQSDEDQLKFLEGVDTILLGRNTYQIFAGYWPEVTTDQEILSDRLNQIPKVVITSSLSKAPWGKWPEAVIASGEATALVKQLKAEKGSDIVVWGSISLAQTLMNADLVDEYRVHVCPVRLGSGIALFPQGQKLLRLQLITTKAYDTGVILLKYARQ